MPLVDLGDRSLYYERRGGGEPLLLIQGMAGHHGIWGEPLLSALAESFDVVSYDHRGIGESSDVPGQFSIAELAEDAIALLDALGWSSAHVLGFSLGGMVAQEVTLGAPDRVRTLVLAASYAGGEGATLAGPGAMQMLEAMNSGDAMLAARAAFSANLSTSYTADETHFEPFMMSALSVAVPVELVVRQAQAAFVHDTSTRLPSITVPTLVLHGTEDQMLLYSNGQQLAGLIPGARLVTFDDVGHLFWWERPAEAAALIREHCLD